MCSRVQYIHMSHWNIRERVGLSLEFPVVSPTQLRESDVYTKKLLLCDDVWPTGIWVIYYVEILEVDLISGAGWIMCAITLAFLALKHRPSFADSNSTYVKNSWVCLALCILAARARCDYRTICGGNKTLTRQNGLCVKSTQCYSVILLLEIVNSSFSPPPSFSPLF